MKSKNIICMLLCMRIMCIQGLGLTTSILSKYSKTTLRQQIRGLVTSETERMMQQNYPHSWWLFAYCMQCARQIRHDGVHSIEVIAPRRYEDSRIAPGLVSLTMHAENNYHTESLDRLIVDNTYSTSARDNNRKAIDSLRRLCPKQQAYVSLDSNHNRELYAKNNFFSRFVPLLADHTLTHQLHLPGRTTLALLRKFLVVGYSPRDLFHESLYILSLMQGDKCQVSEQQYMRVMWTCKNAMEYHAYIFMQPRNSLNCRIRM